MKKIVTLIVAVCALTGCISKEQRAMEQMISKITEPTGFSEFKEYKTICLADEVHDKLLEHKSILSWHESWYDLYSSESPDPEKAAFYKGELVKDREMINLLENIEKDYPDLYNEVSFTIYRMSYLHQDKEGNKTIDICFGRFNNNGEMVAFKQDGTADWVVLGDCCSIPNYDENYCKL